MLEYKPDSNIELIWALRHKRIAYIEDPELLDIPRWVTSIFSEEREEVRKLAKFLNE